MGRAPKRCKRVDIDNLIRGTVWASRPHADYIYRCGGKAVVVEDTGRPEYRDLEKVEHSIEMIRSSNIIGDAVVAGVVHYKRSDTMFNKMAVRRASRRPPILPANCYDKLRKIIRELLGCNC